MPAHLLAQVAETTAQPSTAEAVLFWVLAPIALGSSILTVLSRKAVHAALWLVVVFFCLAVFYAAQDAPFLAAVQVIVYTGAIMVLFLFVLMLVGVDRSDSLVETIRGHRIAALVAALGFAGVLVGAVAQTVLDLPDRGLADVNEDGNVLAVAESLFRENVFAFEVTSALLIVAAMGAMVLAHKERTGPRPSQRELSIRRFAEGGHPSPLPGPGVFASEDTAQTPAVLPTGAPAPDSVVPGPDAEAGPATDTPGEAGGSLGSGAP